MPEVNQQPETAVFQSDLFDYIGLCNHDILHVTSDTKPSRFSVSIIEKLGLARKASMWYMDVLRKTG